MSDFRLRSFVIGQLRRIFRRYPPYYRTLNAAKEYYTEKTKLGKDRKRVRIQCNECKKWWPATKVAVDHIEPIIPTTGFPTLPNGEDDFNTYIKRLFCSDEGLQVLCDDCHSIKTKEENKHRVVERKKKKTLT